MPAHRYKGTHMHIQPRKQVLASVSLDMHSTSSYATHKVPYIRGAVLGDKPYGDGHSTPYIHKHMGISEYHRDIIS